MKFTPKIKIFHHRKSGPNNYTKTYQKFKEEITSVIQTIFQKITKKKKRKCLSANLALISKMNNDITGQ